jgi:hypothetical protein
LGNAFSQSHFGFEGCFQIVFIFIRLGCGKNGFGRPFLKKSAIMGVGRDERGFTSMKAFLHGFIFARNWGAAAIARQGVLDLMTLGIRIFPGRL